VVEGKNGRGKNDGPWAGEATGAEDFYVPLLFSTSFFLAVEIEMEAEIEIIRKKIRRSELLAPGRPIRALASDGCWTARFG
jgi:hypothetical protein